MLGRGFRFGTAHFLDRCGSCLTASYGGLDVKDMQFGVFDTAKNCHFRLKGSVQLEAGAKSYRIEACLQCLTQSSGDTHR